MKLFLKIFIPVAGAVILAFILSVSIRANGGITATFAASGFDFGFNLFKLAGLAAFTLIAFQVLTGPFMRFGAQLYGPKFFRIHGFMGVFALAFSILHPAIIYWALIASGIGILEFSKGYGIAYYLGPLALLLIIITTTTALSAIFFHQPTFQRHWRWIHYANYIIFLLVFLNSITIGSDVTPQESALRPVWWLFFLGMIAGLAYRKVYRLFRARALHPLQRQKPSEILSE